MQDVQQWIKSSEGVKLEPYLDTTGNLTIGWGHNLRDGITQEVADFIFQSDFKRTVMELQQHSWYLMQPPGVQQALINMNFNLGISKMLTFKKMIEALLDKDYTQAALEALDSRWANQVHKRANDIAVMIRAGK